MAARHIARGAAPLVLALAALAAAPACAGSTPVEPTLSTVDLRPKALIEIRSDGLHVTRGPREDAGVVLDPPTFPAGTVSEITNATTTDQRLQGDNGKTFDTGTLEPGERTTVVFSNATGEPVTVAVTDPRDPSIRGSIVVRPKPAA